MKTLVKHIMDSMVDRQEWRERINCVKSTAVASVSLFSEVCFAERGFKPAYISIAATHTQPMYQFADTSYQGGLQRFM